LHFLTPKEVRTLTQTNKKLKKQISENKKLWIHFIESKYGSLKECIHQMYYIPYMNFAYFGTNVSVLKLSPHLDFETMTKSLKTEMSNFRNLENENKEDFDKIFENTNQMLNKSHQGVYMNKENSSVKVMIYLNIFTPNNERDSVQFGFFIYNEDYLPKKKKNQISFDQFQEQFLIQDVMQNVFEFLNDSEILNVSTVCKFWYSITNESDFLLSQIQKKYGSWMNSMLDRCIFEYVVTAFWAKELHFTVYGLCNSVSESKKLIDQKISEIEFIQNRNSTKKRNNGMLTIYQEMIMFVEDEYEFGYVKFSNIWEKYYIPFVPTNN
jgi:hypothetical protein